MSGYSDRVGDDDWGRLKVTASISPPKEPWWKLWLVFKNSKPMYEAEVWPEGNDYELFCREESNHYFKNKVIPTGRWKINTSSEGVTTYLSLEVVKASGGMDFWASEYRLEVGRVRKEFINDCRGEA